jgi:hypothetical protein
MCDNCKKSGYCPLADKVIDDCTCYVENEEDFGYNPRLPDHGDVVLGCSE